MGTKSEHNSSGSRLEEVIQDGEIRTADREYLVNLINMSLKELYDIAYRQGYEDGMSFMVEDEPKH